MLWFFLQLVSETFLIRRTGRDVIPNVHRSSCEVRVILRDFDETWIFWTVFFFEKYSNTKFHENPSSGSRVVPCGRTGRQTDVTKLIVAFRTFANALKNLDVSMYLRNLLGTFRKRYLYSCLESRIFANYSNIFPHISVPNFRFFFLWCIFAL